MTQEQLILVLSEHRNFGWKFNVYTSQLLSSGSIQLLGNALPQSEEKKGLPNNQMQMIRLIDEVSDKSLMKHFSKEKDIRKFKEVCSEETITTLIRPRIEINNRKVIEWLSLHPDFPVFIRENLNSSVLFEKSKLHYLPSPTQCIFHFSKNETGIRYSISLTNNNKEISLQTQPGVIISNEPCIVLIGNEIHQINVDAKKISPFLEKEYILVPLATEKLYLTNFVLKAMQKFEVRLNGIPEQQRFPEPTALLKIETDLHLQPKLCLYFQYDEEQILPENKRKKIVRLTENNGIFEFNWFLRNKNKENQKIQELLAIGFETSNGNVFSLKKESPSSPFALIEWLNKYKQELNGFVIEQNMDKTYFLEEIRLQSAIDIKIDWFDIEMTVIAGNFQIPFIRFRKHILTGNREYLLPDKTILILPEAWFEQFHDFFLNAKEVENKIRLKKIHIGLIDKNISGVFNNEDQEKIRELTQIPLIRPEIPGELKTILRSYQKEGFYWLNHLYRSGFGGCLADDMGLGKTLQTITLLRHIYEQSEEAVKPEEQGQLSLFDNQYSQLPPTLIIVPTSLLHNWKNELRKFAPLLKVHIHTGPDRSKGEDIKKICNRYEIIVTSYGIIRNDIESLKNHPFHYLILDESQYIKNHKSVSYLAVKQLNAAHRLVLTGTPVENSLSDLWAQFNLINEGLLGNYSFFQTNYIHKITKEQNQTQTERLQQLIQPFLLRRTKEEVTPELPPLSQEIIYCDMSETQEKFYNAEKNRIRNGLLDSTENKTGNNQLMILNGLNKLRQSANHPILADSEYDGDSGKFDQIILYLESLKASKHKVLVFSPFVGHLRLFTEYVEKSGWNYALLTGETPIKERESEIQKFRNDPSISCFFISLKAGGTGLNLTMADYVFIIDPWWNPASELQAMSRAHRIGQDKNVMVYRFISSGTVEEKIIHLQTQKSTLSETFIQSNNPLESLNQEEIQSLFE